MLTHRVDMVLIYNAFDLGYTHWKAIAYLIARNFLKILWL